MDRPRVAEQGGAERCPNLHPEIGDVPWRAPSVPIAELSNQPEYEVRTAILPVPSERAEPNEQAPRCVVCSWICWREHFGRWTVARQLQGTLRVPKSRRAP